MWPGARLAVGKLPTPQLDALLARLPRHDDRLAIGPQVGEDAAVVEIGDRYLVCTADPVTLATDRIGWYAVHVNANDVAVMGARPRWFFAVLLLPERHATASMAEAIAADIAATCDALGVSVAGGHTEITAGLDRPIVVGQMLGEVERPALVRKSRLAVGDRVLLTRGVAIEGTAIVAREKRAWLEGRLPDDVIARAATLLFNPGISVVEAALTAAAAGDVHAMHDPTEGGLVAGLFEFVTPANLGLHVFGDLVPVLPETKAVCDLLGVDPLRLIASGALLIGAAPAECERIAAALAGREIPATVIAEVRPKDEGITLEIDGQSRALSPPNRDEIARIFEMIDPTAGAGLAPS